jgi:RNA-splicing ligase RtcB
LVCRDIVLMTLAEPKSGQLLGYRTLRGLWLLVHSGSRGLGAPVAHHHARAADAGDVDDLAGMDVRTATGRAYLDDLSWALDFARANRLRIEERDGFDSNRSWS